jgi:FkbM family methyltransferase
MMIGFKNIRDFWYCHVAPERYAEKMFFSGIKKVSAKFVQPGDLVFDIGANVGVFSRIYLDLGARELIAVEPQEPAYLILKNKFGKDSRFIGYQAVVADYIGVTEFYRQTYVNSRFSVGEGSSLHKEAIERSKRERPGVKWITEKVPTITMNYLIQKHGLPDFCKIDTEGHESVILSTLKEPLPKLSFELWPRISGIMNIFDILESLGDYKFNYNFSGNYNSLALNDFVVIDDMKNIIKNLISNDENCDRTIDVYAILNES